ncbi:MAG TPA: hypothetical protein VMH28_30755 [Candidatus Acidoferrales bacterium]|nr:hypothetical protein [Candidatus Acidoferrales bacterium]
MAIFILAAVVTPSTDVFNLVLFATPMCALFYLGVFGELPADTAARGTPVSLARRGVDGQRSGSSGRGGVGDRPVLAGRRRSR